MRVRFTAKGLSVIAFTARISALSASLSLKVEEDSMPRPPAAETAPASGARAIHCMQPWIMGYSMPRSSVTAVFSPTFIMYHLLFRLKTCRGCSR